MENNLKNQIVDALMAYMAKHKLTQSQVAKATEINPAYISSMKSRTFKVSNVDISDKYFQRIARYIGMEVDKKYWERKTTPQMKELFAELQTAKENGEPLVYVNETGSGKTYTLELLETIYPKDFFVIKASESDKLPDILDKITRALGLEPFRKSTSSRIFMVKRTIKLLHEKGLKPAIFIDEAEFLKVPALCAYKELFDHLNGFCSLGLIGTDQLIDNIEKLVKRNKPGMPQFYRRIKFKVRRGIRIDRRYDLFIQDKPADIQKWLRKYCNNYGELADVVTSVWREAERLNRPVTVEFIETVLGLEDNYINRP